MTEKQILNTLFWLAVVVIWIFLVPGNLVHAYHVAVAFWWGGQ